jgi:hypothetical protein
MAVPKAVRRITFKGEKGKFSNPYGASIMRAFIVACLIAAPATGMTPVKVLMAGAGRRSLEKCAKVPKCQFFCPIRSNIEPSLLLGASAKSDAPR